MKKYDLLTSIVLLVLGILLLFIPGDIATLVIRLFGIAILALGILSIYNTSKNKSSNTDFTYGILISILGLVFISSPQTIASIIPFILGVWIVLRSVVKLQFVSTLKKDGNEYIKSLVINVLELILGLVLIFNPFKGAEALMRIIGIFIIVYSGLDILNYYFSKPKQIKVIK